MNNIMNDTDIVLSTAGNAGRTIYYTRSGARKRASALEASAKVFRDAAESNFSARFIPDSQKETVVIS